ncbi:hypothetical protein [Catellatospora paridis]|uniref:hypothetical protein n=1 Tax=Catellatospora paridis TaxID=1617086 RepID=UPI0012D49839|nr:hypothetical protein [Catellatospora paridis]
MNGFEAWLAYLFDRPADDDGSWDDQPHEWFDRYARQDTPAATAERIRELFGNAGSLLRRHSDDQVACGVRDIVDDGLGVLRSRQVPVVLRTTGLRSIVTLFAEVFAARISVEQPRNEPQLQSVCFMFFDIAPLDLGDDTVLDVLEDTLALPSVPCQRAALHGLGHAHCQAPQAAQAIVDRWLARHRHAPQEVRDYATAARAGQVM